MPTFCLDAAAVADVLEQQDGVISRRQLLSLGAQPHDVARLLRRRELARAFDGVYVNHTGPLTPRQRDWVAVQAAWPAALTGASALPNLSSARVQLVVGRGRSVRVPPWAVLRRADDLPNRVLWYRRPPLVPPEHAILEEMSIRVTSDDVAGAFHALTRVVHDRRTTVERILAVLAERRRLPGRALIRSLLIDLRDGACSVLERGYLRQVERAHGLPCGQRQHRSRATGSTTLQDVRYDSYRLIVELDGRAYHSSASTVDDDAFRDLCELAANRIDTARLTYGLVFRTPCRTARVLADLFRERGWTGSLRSCRRCPSGPTDGR